MSDELPTIGRDELSDDAVILDVRADDQWSAGHAPGAVHIPFERLQARLIDLPTTPGPLPVTCGGGTKAGRAVAILRKNGVDAVEIKGGMRGWKADGRPLVS